MLVSVLGGLFLGSIDIAIVNIATPSMRDTLSASSARLELIVSDYRVPEDSTSDGVGATIVAMSTESLRSVRDHLSEVVDRVEHHHERVVITRNGRDAAILISPDDLAEIEETVSVLADPEAVSDIRESEQSIARGDVVRGSEAVQQLLRER